MKPINDEFTKIVREHQAGLRAYIRRLGIAVDWVDDLAQEVFMVAYRRWDDFEQERDIGRWLYGIARNLVANELRKGGRKARVIFSPLTDNILAAEEEKRYEPEASRLMQAMRECLRQLPRLSRELLHHRYAEQENAQQLSERLHISPVAVRLKLMRIRESVRTCVEGKLV